MGVAGRAGAEIFSRRDVEDPPSGFRVALGEGMFFRGLSVLPFAGWCGTGVAILLLPGLVCDGETPCSEVSIATASDFRVRFRGTIRRGGVAEPESVGSSPSPDSSGVVVGTAWDFFMKME